MNLRIVLENDVLEWMVWQCLLAKHGQLQR